jgi:MoaA/NifB/PqqE/SkfB family radical SAM enzyme
VRATLPLLKVTDFPPIRRRSIEALQLNLGYTCNQTCVHCHVNAGPNRTEQMDGETVDLVLGCCARARFNLGSRVARRN